MSHIVLNPRVSYKSLVTLALEYYTIYKDTHDPFERAEMDKYLNEISDFCYRRGVEYHDKLFAHVKGIYGQSHEKSVYGVKPSPMSVMQSLYREIM